jgi:hypothetical protein
MSTNAARSANGRCPAPRIGGPQIHRLLCGAHCGIAAACRAHGRHKLDDTFFTPRVIVGVSIYSNEMAHAARPRLLADIMLRLFHLSVRAHSAQRAAHAVQP